MILKRERIMLRHFVKLIEHGSPAHRDWLRRFVETYINCDGQIPDDVLKRLQDGSQT